MFDYFITYGCAILGLASHGASKHKFWLWVVRIVAIILACFEFISAIAYQETKNIEFGYDPLFLSVITILMCVGTLSSLFIAARKFYSFIFTFFDWIATFQFVNFVNGKQKFLDSVLNRRIFVPTSIPHMTSLYVYFTSFLYLVGGVNFSGLGLPSLPIPIPIQIDQLFSYNGLSLVFVSFCGVGIFVTRKFRGCLDRLGLVLPSRNQIYIGLSLIAMSFLYDYLWSLLTHNMGQELAVKLTNYNAGTFGVTGGLAASVTLALATAVFAGIGEETLIRGALQPVFGIIPAAFLHGLLHGQFAHAPIFILQVALWSCIMGMVKHRCNTTTTIIGHAGFNFCTTFLFAFNP